MTTTHRARTAALGALGALALTAGLLAPSAPSASGAPTSPVEATAAADRGPAVITVNGYGAKGLTVVDTMGFDLKQPGTPGQFTQAAADTLFGRSGAGLFDLVRIPVYAREAHPEAGVSSIKRSMYEGHVTAIRRIAGYQDRVKVFASLRLVGNYKKDRTQQSFPGWAKSGGRVDPAAYSRLLLDYLVYMDAVRGIEIDYLGVDNERYLNDGELTPALYNSVVSRLKTRLADWNKKYAKQPSRQINRPTFVASDNYRPDTEWFADLSKAPGGWSHAGVVGVHWYSEHRDATRGTNPKVRLRTDFTKVAEAAKARRKPLWQNEYHFTQDRLAGNEYAMNVRGVLGASDNFDRGASGLTWWSYSHYCAGGDRKEWCDGSPRARLTTRIAQTTSDSRILPAPTDRDGAANDTGTFVTRAFRRGSTVMLWITNDTDTAHPQQAVRVPGWNVPAGYTASFQQWRRTAATGSDNLGFATGAVRADAAADVVRLTVPARSITIVTLPIR